MNASEFRERLLDVAEHYRTAYIWGGLGRPITPESLAGALKQYPEQNAKFCAIAQSLIGNDRAFLFDCVGLLKSILWGWSGNHNADLGGAVYGSNGVPDMTADTMIGKCANVSQDFNNVLVGEALWLPGHIGVYVGDGLAVECTPAFDSGVQITYVLNIGVKPGYAGRHWASHGMLPWIDYGNPIQTEIDALPEWERPTFQKLYDKGILKGDGKSLNLQTLTPERLCVLLDRAGAWDK